ncbi:MAG: DEAD/DEAH box helicase [Oscillospiraceae bacterium]|nr:DEAD/DEAH box helicase [Oscillospiraceae bacterium]
MTDLAEFRALGIADSILTALAAKGFETPSEVQQLAIPLLLAGEKDVVAQARTGTGKTAAFGVPIIQILGEPEQRPRALILTPTRELALQVCTELESLQSESGLKFVPVFGGQSIMLQLGKIRHGADVIVGTPGRVMDLIRRGELKLDSLEFAVLDEADEMLDMGFIDDIREILAVTNPDKRMLMFSATMPPPIMTIAKEFMRDCEIVRSAPGQLPVAQTKQIYYSVRREDKLEALARVIDLNPEFYGIIFCRTKCDVDELYEQLSGRKYRVEPLHGDIPQPQRLRTIDRFRQRRFNILLATDVAARGIDVADLTTVVNYSIPQTTETYVHRIGRTGRAGKEGLAVTFVTPAEQRRIAIIMREAKCEIERASLPCGDEVVNRKLADLKEKINSVSPDDTLAAAAELLNGAQHPVQVIAGLLNLLCGDELNPDNYPDLAAAAPRGRAIAAGKRKRLFVGLGKIDKKGAKAILDVIYEKSGIGCQKLGKVDCYDRFSFVDASPEDAEKILYAFRNQTRNGKPMVTLAKDKDGQPQDDNTERESAGHADASFSAPKRNRYPRRDGADYNDARPERRHAPAVEKHTPVKKAATLAEKNDPVGKTTPAAGESDGAEPPKLNRRQRRAIMFAEKKQPYGIK